MPPAKGAERRRGDGRSGAVRRTRKRVGTMGTKNENPNRTCYKYRYKTLKLRSHQWLLIDGFQVLSNMVPGEGVEPSHPFGRQILSLLEFEKMPAK